MGREYLAKKSKGLDERRKGQIERFWSEVIHSLRSEYNLDLLLEIKGMVRSTFYYHLKRLGNASKYEKEKKRIQEIFQESKGRYVYRRITLQLRNDGYAINHKTVEKLMQELGIKCLIRKKRYRSYKGTVGKIAPNILNRDFKTDCSCRKLATDVSQI